MSPFGLKFSQMILHTKTSKLMYNWSFLFVVLHKPTLLPSTFKLHTLQEHFHTQNYMYFWFFTPENNEIPSYNYMSSDRTFTLKWHCLTLWKLN